MVKDIEEWNILGLENIIIVKKKRSKIEDENFQLFYLRYLVTSILFYTTWKTILADWKKNDLFLNNTCKVMNKSYKKT